MKIHELETPALIVDLDRMEGNLQRMADYCHEHGLNLRPHTKTHKIPQLAQKQMDLGARGITVAKVGEAEVMSEEGLDDLLLAYPLFGDAKALRLGAVLERARITVSLDSAESLNWVARAADGKSIDVLVEIDVGMRRCGLKPGPAAVQLAQLIDSTAGLRFEGLMFYPGHIHPAWEDSNRKLEQLNSDLQRQLEFFEKQKVPVHRVSGGSTPSAFYSHHIPALTEIRPGTYIFNDRHSLEWKTCSEDQCAASVVTTVVSRAVTGQAIIDGGSKTFSSDPLRVGKKGGFGLVKGFPEVQFGKMNEEHGYLKVPDEAKLEIGQTVQVIPNHICATVNLHDTVFGYRDEEVVESWIVKGRGKIH
jgi:D-serine deaminase-like pyridoxal phosphate-dependent protein